LPDPRRGSERDQSIDESPRVVYDDSQQNTNRPGEAP
jgi:hypothetical protein